MPVIKLDIWSPFREQGVSGSIIRGKWNFRKTEFYFKNARVEFSITFDNEVLLIDYELMYKGKEVDIIHVKFFEEKERSFWHIISEGDDDVNRTPISWRAETIIWIKPLISED